MRRIFLFVFIFFLAGCSELEDQFEYIDLNRFLSDKRVEKILYNDFRETVWIVAAKLSEDPSKMVYCGPLAFDYYLIKVDGENYGVEENVTMITDWTICAKHNLWIISENQVKKVSNINDHLSVYTESEGYLNSLVADTQGNLWACGTEAGVLKMDENLNWERFTSDNSAVPSLDATKMVIGTNDTKWISFDDGDLSLLRIRENEDWEHFICENDGPYCMSSLICAVDINDDLIMSFTSHQQAGITFFDGLNYHENFVLDNGSQVNGNLIKVKIANDKYYCLIRNIDANVSVILSFNGDNWITIYSSDYISDFEIVNENIWIGTENEGLVKVGIS